MMRKTFKLREVFFILKECRINDYKIVLAVLAYYFFSLLSTLLDGISVLLLTDLLFYSKLNKGTSIIVVNILERIIHLDDKFKLMYIIVIILFVSRALMIFLMTNLQGYMTVIFRRKMQEKCYLKVIKGNWENLRNIRVGGKVGAITQEASNVSLYMVSLILAVYCFLGAIILGGIAMSVNIEITLIFLLVSGPFVIILNYLFNKKGRISQGFVNERQEFYGKVSEDFSGLLQIKVSRKYDYQYNIINKRQENLSKLEFKQFWLRSFIDIINFNIPAVALVGMSLWASIKGVSLPDIIPLFAQVGIVGTRAKTQINNLIAYLGTLTTLSGSITPVYNLLHIHEEKEKSYIKEKVIKITVKDASYWYNEEAGFSSINTYAKIGESLIIKGPSGSGKTTLANLVAGLYDPSNGEIIYTGISGKTYNSQIYRPKIGYVTQDIMLFKGSVRENLLPHSIEKHKILDALKKAGAYEFVNNMGGLDAEIAEAGRSLSGGEKRRLGIARVLLEEPDILILDEVTVGLDESKKMDIIDTIQKLAHTHLIILITHENIEMKNSNTFLFEKRTDGSK